MSFRNDHDAAISRIAALEHELAKAREEAREQSAREQGRIAMLEREIADLRRGEPPPPRVRAPSTPPVVGTAPARPIEELPGRGPAVSGSVLFAMIALAGATIGALLWFLMLRPEVATKPAVSSCEIRSEPLYADVIGVRRGVELRLGIAPIERSFDEWREYSRLIVRLPGHEDRIVEPPSSVTTCPTESITLIRR